MSWQLDLDGNEVLHPPRVPVLTQRQRSLLVWARSRPEIRTRTVGVLYANPSQALRRLEALGLVEQTRRGWWRAR